MNLTASSVADYRVRLEDFLSNNEFPKEPLRLYESVSHIMNIKGKRIRPLLALASCELLGGDVEKALAPAAAVEIFHNFTLVHDDILDASEIRRGKPTVHMKYGENQAILAGDAMIPWAYDMLMKNDPDNLADLMRVFNKVCKEVIDGQQLDIDFETRLDVQEDEYITMIGWKTSVLLAASLQLGAIVANASKADQELIYDFGLNLGLAFQIKDDWLDTFGTSAKVGKRIGGDILNNKKTYLLVTALNKASDEQMETINQLFEESDEQKKIDGFMEIFEELKVSEAAQAKMKELYDKALFALDSMSVKAEEDGFLKELAREVYNRDH